MGNEISRGPLTPEVSGRNAVAVTPHDTNELTNYSRALYVGTSGNLVVRLAEMATGTVTFSNVSIGWHPIAVKLVHTDSTADGIVAVW